MKKKDTKTKGSLKPQQLGDIYRSLIQKKHWYYCYNATCSQSADCAAFISTQFIDKDVPMDEAILTVRPDAHRQPGGCTRYCRATMERKAAGFSHLFDQVRGCHIAKMREQMMRLLDGRTSYYRHHRGEKWLSVQQQSDIAALFHQNGYESPTFDFYQEVPEVVFCSDHRNSLFR